MNKDIKLFVGYTALNKSKDTVVGNYTNTVSSPPRSMEEYLDKERS